MVLTHVPQSTRHHLSRCISALVLGISIGGLLFPPVGLSAVMLDPSLKLQATQNDAGPQRLSDAEIQLKMQDLPDWELNGDVIQSQRQFGDFVEAIAFVNRLVEPAEAAGHHPDIAISYNTVTLTLTTHDVGGLTEQDFDLAAVISDIQ